MPKQQANYSRYYFNGVSFSIKLLPCNLVIAALLHNGCCLSTPPALHLVGRTGYCGSGAKPGHAAGPAGLEELLRHQAEGGGAVG